MVTETQAKLARADFDGPMTKETLLYMAGRHLVKVEDVAFALTYYDIEPKAKEVLRENWPGKYDNVNWSFDETEEEKEEEDDDEDGNKSLQDVLDEL